MVSGSSRLLCGAQRPEFTAGDGFGHRKRVAPKHIDVFVAEGRKPCLVLKMYRERFSAKLIEYRIQIDGVPQNDHVDDQPKRAQLVFLTFAIALVELAALAMEHISCQAMPAFPQVGLCSVPRRRVSSSM